MSIFVLHVFKSRPLSGPGDQIAEERTSVGRNQEPSVFSPAKPERVVTSATLLGTGALLVTRSYYYFYFNSNSFLLLLVRHLLLLAWHLLLVVTRFASSNKCHAGTLTATSRPCCRCNR